jgi:hypothetical protein
MRSSTPDAPAAGYGWLDVLAGLMDSIADLALFSIDMIAGIVTTILG